MNFTTSINSSISRTFFSKNILLIALFFLSISVRGQQKIVIAEGDTSICIENKITLNARFSIGTFVYFHSANGKAYFLDTVARSWTEANAAAEFNGMKLWMIKQIGESSDVWNKIPSKSKTTNSFFWIGLLQENKADLTGGPDAGWKWVDGTLLDLAIAKWATGEPDNFFQASPQADYGSIGINGTQNVLSDMPNNLPITYKGYAIAQIDISGSPVFTWQSKTGSTSNPDVTTAIPNHIVQPLAATTYTVKVDLNSFHQTSKPINVTVNKPSQAATFTVDVNSVDCLLQNKFTFLLDQSGISDPLNAHFLWEFGDGNKSILGSSQTHEYSKAGPFTVSLTVTDKNGCSSVYKMPSPLVVRDAPLPTIIKVPQAVICEGQEAVLSVFNPQDLVDYKWYDRSGNLLITGLEYKTKIGGKYTLETTLRSSGCKESVDTVIIVNLPPTRPIFKSSESNVCQNDILLLSTIPTTENLVSFIWYSDALPKRDTTLLGKYIAKAPSSMGSNPQNINFYVITTDKNKCNSQPSLAYSITFYPSPTVQISSKGEPTVFCTGGSVELTIVGGMQSGFTYDWLRDNNSISLNNTITNLVTSTGAYQVEVINSITQCSSKSTPINVEVNEFPSKPLIIPDPSTPEITAAGIKICPGKNTKLNTNSLLDASYQWFFNDVPIPSANGVNITIKDVGTYTVKTSLKGCSTTSDKKEVFLLPEPQGIFMPPVFRSICDGDSLKLTSSDADNYQWHLNYKPISLATQPILYAKSSGVYQVEFSTAQGCKKISDSLVILSTLKKPTAVFNYDFYCVNASSSFTNYSKIENSGPVNYLWEFQNGETADSANPTHVFTTSGLYNVKLKVIPTYCPQLVDSSIAQIDVKSPDQGIQISPIEAIVGKPISLIEQRVGKTYEWIPSTGLDNPASATPLLTPTTEQFYKVKVKNNAGCVTVDSLLVRIFDEHDIYIAGGFTPNNDGKNDKVFPFLVGINSFHYLKIFNRWGNLVFQTTSVDPQMGWDGKYQGRDQPADTYTWVVEAEGNSGKVFRKSGSLILIR